MNNKYSTWTTPRDRWTPKERKEIKRNLETAFVQAFILSIGEGFIPSIGEGFTLSVAEGFVRKCFACGGPVKPDGRGSWICENCGVYQ